MIPQASRRHHRSRSFSMLPYLNHVPTRPSFPCVFVCLHLLLRGTSGRLECSSRDVITTLQILVPSFSDHILVTSSSVLPRQRCSSPWRTRRVSTKVTHLNRIVACQYMLLLSMPRPRQDGNEVGLLSPVVLDSSLMATSMG